MNSRNEAAALTPAYIQATDLPESFRANGLAGGLRDTALWGTGELAALAPQVAQQVGVQALTRGMTKGLGSVHSSTLANTAGFVGNLAQEAGSIYSDTLEKTGQREGANSLGYAVPAALLDTASEAIPMGRLFGKGLGTGNLASDAAKKGLAGAFTEALPEVGQTIIERAAVANIDPDQQIFTPEGKLEMINAGAVGGLAGGVGGADDEGGGVGGGSASAPSPSTQGSVPETPTTTPTAADAERTRERGKTTIIIQNMIGERTWVANNLIPLLEEAEGNRGWNAEVRS
jgi:hypothetical protein